MIYLQSLFFVRSGFNGVRGLSGHGLSILVAPESVEVGEDAEHGVTMATSNQVVQSNAQWVQWPHHVEDFVLDVLQRHRLLSVRSQLLLNCLLKKPSSLSFIVTF